MQTTAKSSAAEEVGRHGSQIPDATWTPDDLARYARARLDAARSTEAQALKLGRRSAVEAYRAGHALVLARDLLTPQGKWTSWQKKHHLPITSVWEAIQIYEGAGCEKAVFGLTIGEARGRWVHPTPKKDKPREEDEPEVIHPHDGEDKDQYGTITINNATAEIRDESLKGVSPIDGTKDLFVCGTWNDEARQAAARGVVVLVVSGLDRRFRR